MAMVSKLKGKHYRKNDKQISEEEKKPSPWRKEPRKEGRKEGRKEPRKEGVDVIARASFFFLMFLVKHNTKKHTHKQTSGKK